MCRDGHEQVWHNDSGDDERCPVCRERDRADHLQELLDSRPAINAGLPESYIKWSQSIYVTEAYAASGIKPS